MSTTGWCYEMGYCLNCQIWGKVMIRSACWRDDRGCTTLTDHSIFVGSSRQDCLRHDWWFLVDWGLDCRSWFYVCWRRTDLVIVFCFSGECWFSFEWDDLAPCYDYYAGKLKYIKFSSTLSTYFAGPTHLRSDNRI